MSNRDKIYDQIDRYLDGTLSGEELLAFMERLTSDFLLQEKLEEHRELRKALSFHYNRKNLKEKLEFIHEESINNESGVKPRGIRRFLSDHWSTIAVAASVSGITVALTLFTFFYTQNVEKKQTQFYSELKRELNKIEKKQDHIMADYVNGNRQTVTPTTIGGTGFALSSDGYIVTSCHVIQGTDSIIVENKNSIRYKVKEVYKDQKYDLAILKIEDPEFKGFGQLPYSFKKSASDLGGRVFTLGFPKEDIVYGEGYISSSSGFLGDTLDYQVSIPVNVGNSGSPLFDEKGNIVGIVSGKLNGTEGAAFAVKAGYLLNLVGQLSEENTDSKISISNKNKITMLPRQQQIERVKDYIFMIKAYKSN